MKKRILIFIFLVVTVGGVFFTAFTAYRFSTITDLAIKHSAETIRDMYLYSTDKDEALDIIQNMPNIDSVEIIKKINTKNTNQNISNNTIILPINNDENMLIKFKFLTEFSNEKYQVILETIIINIIFIIISNLLLNWLITPYLNFFEEFRKSIEKAKNGDFSLKLYTKLKNELQKVIENYNSFLDQLNKNFTLINNNLQILIPNIPKHSNKLVSVQDNMEMLANINKFKKIIEEDANVGEVYNRIIDIFESKFKLKNFKLYAILNQKQEIKVIYQKGKNCCSIGVPGLCRAYRTSKEVNAIKFPNICSEYLCDNSYICIPFSTGGTFTGIASIHFSNDEYEKIKCIIPYIEAYLNESASIIEAKYTLNLMKQSSITDQLTGLYNRRYLEETLEKIASSALREKSLIGVLMIDVDYFKQINDTLGHDAGDEVLKELANVLINSVRDSDFVIRYGGEEFIVLLQNIKDQEAILKVAEKIRQSFANTKIVVSGKTINRTISIGISIFPEDTKNIWEAIKYADLALYEAKNTGRNKIIKFNSSLLHKK